MIKTVDLFSGCGGLSLGFERAGFQVIAAFDNWEPAVKVYRDNFSHPIYTDDLSDENVQNKIAEMHPDVIIGGPPCQDYSSAGHRDITLGRAALTLSYRDIIIKARPKYFLMENVPEIRKYRILADIIQDFKNAGYGLTQRILEASYYGVPQARKRFILIGGLNEPDDFLGVAIDRRASDHAMTMRDYFGDSLDVDYYFRVPRSYSRRGIFSIDEPCQTIRGVDRPIPPGYPGHPSDPVPLGPNVRALTVKERSMVQTFPETFKFSGNKTDQNQMIGNAVPVNLAKAVADALYEHIVNKNGPSLKGVDLFAGCGGMTLGFEKAGVDILAGYDNWKPACDIYSANFSHPIISMDLFKQDKNLSNVSCKVSGGVPGHERDAVDWMEWQANALAPRIQMPKATFKKRADQLFSQFRRETDEFAIVDLIEKVITQLTVDFGVSKLAAKIRMIDVGYDEAMGAFIYVDDHYVRPYRTGQRNILKPNQTFTISAADAAIQIFSNMSLRKKTESGCFQFVENHLVLNDPLFIEQDILGDTVLTHYARNHMEECCLVFDLEIKNKYGEHYHSECFLNRDEATPVTFGVTFTGGYQNSTFDKQMAKLEVVLEEENLFCLSLTDDYRDSLRKGMVWREEMSYKEVIVHSRLNKDEVEKMHETMSYREIAEKKKLRTDSVTKITNKEIGDRAGINEETVGRCISGTRVNQHTLILICLALHLPYLASMKILNTAGVGLKMVDKSQQWYHFVLMHMYGHLVTEIKDFLAARGADPL